MNWVKIAVMLVVTVVWAIYMLVFVVISIINGELVLPDPIVFGIPGAVYFALNPTFPGRRSNREQTTQEAK